MDVFDAIQTRRSIRKFTGAAVPCDDLEKIVNAGRLAASGMNTQSWQFIVVTQADLMRQLRVPEDHWTQHAGAVISVVMNPATRWWVEDAAAAVQNMLLATTALGYGACWIEGYTLRNEEVFKKHLGIPDHLRLFTLVAVGVPTEQPLKDKKPLSKVLHWQRYTDRSTPT